MRQNIDFSVNDAKRYNPHLSASDIYRGISVAHSLAGGTAMYADEAAARSQSSYCALASAECGNHGGVYMAPGYGCNVAVGNWSVPQPMFLKATALINGDTAQKATASAKSFTEYETYWRAGARVNLDSVSESQCLPELWSPLNQMTSLAAVTAAAAAVPTTNSAIDMSCYSSCLTNVKQTNAGAACHVLCQLQPNIVAEENTGPFSTAVPTSQPRFDADLPLEVGIGACLRQCVDAPLPAQQQACRLGCVAQTNAPPVFKNAAGPCVLACMSSCTAAGQQNCNQRCLQTCTGAKKQSAYARPSETINLGL